MLINPKIPYSAMGEKWKSDLESVSGTRVPPKVHQFF